jgi:guanine nucleotide-binding protein alpha-1 subunit
MTYARKEWTQERASWRAVIQLNLVRNVNTILDILAEEISGFRSGSDDDEYQDSRGPSPSTTITPTGTSLPTQFSEKHRLLKLRLGPLRRIQKDLESRLGAAATELHSTTVSTAAPFDVSDLNVIPGEPVVQEFSINSNNGWKTALDRFRPVRAAAEASSVAQKRGWNAEATEIAEVIAGCAEDMKAMWEDPMFRAVLSRRDARVEYSPGL